MRAFFVLLSLALLFRSLFPCTSHLFPCRSPHCVPLRYTCTGLLILHPFGVYLPAAKPQYFFLRGGYFFYFLAKPKTPHCATFHFACTRLCKLYPFGACRHFLFYLLKSDVFSPFCVLFSVSFLRFFVNKSLFLAQKTAFFGLFQKVINNLQPCAFLSAFPLCACFSALFPAPFPLFSLPFAHQRFGGVGGAAFGCFFLVLVWAFFGFF